MSSALASFFSPSEIWSMYQVKHQAEGFQSYRGDLCHLPTKEISEWDFCYAVLNVVSRSFALVINQLPNPLKDAICIFYLVLRGLDSVEDDQDFPELQKIPLLRTFHEKLQIDDFRLENVGDTDDYRFLMRNFDKVIHCFKSLDLNFQETISNITQRMGNGMADFVGKNSIETIEDYNLYCHYVAGLVGIGLIHLFAKSGLEDEQLIKQEDLANKMGLFLQKTNIIRDYLEDIQVNRLWWPKEIYEQHGFTQLIEIQNEPTSKRSLDVLNHMINDALELMPSCIQFMSLLHNQKIFQFCAIPQVMAIGTLQLLYNNSAVYTGVVKMRKGLACRYILETNNFETLKCIFHDCCHQISQHVRSDHYLAENTLQKLQSTLLLTQTSKTFKRHPDLDVAVYTCTGVAVAAIAYYYYQRRS
jgi:farnesyl-diphosphate farnesyltransferase